VPDIQWLIAKVKRLRHERDAQISVLEQKDIHLFELNRDN
jgi:hypothetical protein